MLRRRQLAIIVCAFASFAGTVCAQAKPPAEGNEAPPAKFYRLEFVVQEVEDAKVVNSRSYVVYASSASNASIRTGNKVQISTGSNMFNFIDVGVNIDFGGIRESGNNLMLNLTAEVSSLAPKSESVPNATPTVRQNKWNSGVIVPLRKPVVVFASDDLASKRKMQLQLTATPIG